MGDVPANLSVYSGGVLNTGVVTDRNGVVLARSGDAAFAYASDASVRKACLHAVGDYNGYIGTGALKAFSDRLVGYSPVFGTTRDGRTLSLSIDSALQVAALEAMGGQKGAVLVMNYETGEILCMLSCPTYDPQNPPASFDGAAYEGVWLNRCLSSAFTPGSVFKLATLAAAIENIDDLYSRSFTCAGSVQVGDKPSDARYSRHADHRTGAGELLQRRFRRDIPGAGRGDAVGIRRRLGLTESHDLDGIPRPPGASTKRRPAVPTLPGRASASTTTLYALFHAASGGRRRRRRFAERAYPPERRRQRPDRAAFGAYGGKNWGDDELQRGLCLRKRELPGLSVCAETGTAEVGDGTSHAWFTGFLDSGKPLAFVVVVEHGGGGLSTAGRVANAVLQKAVLSES